MAVSVSAQNNASFVTGAIQERIQKEAERIYQQEVDRMVENLVEKMAEEKEKILAAVTLRITRTFDIQTGGDRVIVTIDAKNLRSENATN